MAQIIVIFGASGDLTSRKLIPALYQLDCKKRFEQPLHIVGVSRTPLTDEQWRNKLGETTAQFVGASFDHAQWEAFAPSIHYFSGDIDQPEMFGQLDAYLQTLDSESNRLYYLSTSPMLYPVIIKQLGQSGMSDPSRGTPTRGTPSRGARRVVIEKPFGRDLESAQQLNQDVHESFDEHQVFRIDHYLGKETVSNVLVLRFGNTIFEPIWNRNYIDNIQITANEDVLVGHRAAFYEKAGVLRDMCQNHLLQLLTFVTMEPPARFDADAVRDEKVKVLRAIRAMTPDEVLANTLCGQYDSYRSEPGVDPASRTATYAAMRLLIDNWRWKDVPIYLRSGKGMSCRTTQIVVQFRQPPHMMFDCKGATPYFAPNRLLIQIQPAEGIQIYFQTKVPDTDMQLRQSEFKFNFRESCQCELPEAYQRLLLDALQGDASLFARNDEVEAAWRIIDPILRVWEDQSATVPERYEINSWGPPSADDWIRRWGHEWFDLCPVLY